MKKILEKPGLVLTSVAILALALWLCWYLTGDDPRQMKTAGKSPYQTAPLEQYEAQAEQEHYNSGIAEIKIAVRNGGETMHEFYHPILEWQNKGLWYSLRKEEGSATADLLFIEPGETKTFSLWTESYGKLDPGRYRTIFQAWGSTDYIAAEFSIA